MSCYHNHAQFYDQYQMVVVPRYQEALEITAKAAVRYCQPLRRVLDLGCGTGNATLVLLSLNPNVGVTLLDGSSAMVDLAVEKVLFHSRKALQSTMIADLNSSGWERRLEGGFDAIISTLVLEHLPFTRYREVIGTCARLLRPGGWLLAVEGYEEGDLLPWFMEEMETQQRNMSHLMKDDTSQRIALQRSVEEVHYYTTIGEKMTWWREAGLEDVHMIWQYLCIGLMAGKRPIYIKTV